MSRRNPKPVLARCVLIVFGLVAGLGLSLAFVSFTLRFMTHDDDRGWALRPGAEGRWSSETNAYLRINSDGLRDREHILAKPLDTIRVAILGDSYAEAAQVLLEDTFWSVLERQLDKCPTLGGRRVEAINFGVSGYGTAQQYITLQKHVWKYSPDIVVLAFYDGNDVVNNSRALETQIDRPFYVYRDGALVLDKSTVRLSWWSVVLQLIELKVRQKQIAQRMMEDDVKMFSPPQDHDWEEAWRVTERLLVLMKEDVEKNRAAFLVATVGNGISTHPDPEVRVRFIKENRVQDLLYADKRIAALGEREGLAVLNLTELFQGYAERTGVCLSGFPNADPCFGHWNATGHALAGSLIADRLCRARSSAQRRQREEPRPTTPRTTGTPRTSRTSGWPSTPTDRGEEAARVPGARW